MGILDNLIKDVTQVTVRSMMNQPPVSDPAQKVKDSVDLIKTLLVNERATDEDIAKIKDNRVESSNPQSHLGNRANKYTSNRGFWYDVLSGNDLTNHFRRPEHQPEIRDIVSNLQKLALCLKDGKFNEHDDLKTNLKKCFGLDGISIGDADPTGIERHNILTQAFDFVKTFPEYSS